MQTGDRVETKRAPFVSISHAVAWYVRHNPARQKFQNLLEPVRGNKPAAEQFAGEHPNDLHAAVLGAIEAVLDQRDYEHRLVFEFCDIGKPPGLRYHPVEAAELLDMSKRTVYRMLGRVRDDLEHELKRRFLIENDQ